MKLAIQMLLELIFPIKCRLGFDWNSTDPHIVAAQYPTCFTHSRHLSFVDTFPLASKYQDKWHLGLLFAAVLM